MLSYISIFIVICAGIGIFEIRSVAEKIKSVFHANKFIDYQIKFQALQVALSMFVLLPAYLLNTENFLRFFRIGNLNANISKITWLGITGKETWLQISLTLGIFITIATGIFMAMQLKKAGIRIVEEFRTSTIWKVLAWAVIFSIANAFSEEAIFRMGIVSPLYGTLSTAIVLIISGFLFGVPHYFGQPSGIVGVFMAGFLGWLLALSLVETQGFFLAWAIHFVQDIIIITSMILITSKKS